MIHALIFLLGAFQMALAELSAKSFIFSLCDALSPPRNPWSRKRSFESRRHALRNFRIAERRGPERFQEFRRVLALAVQSGGWDKFRTATSESPHSAGTDGSMMKSNCIIRPLRLDFSQKRRRQFLAHGGRHVSTPCASRMFPAHEGDFVVRHRESAVKRRRERALPQSSLSSSSSPSPLRVMNSTSGIPGTEPGSHFPDPR